MTYRQAETRAFNECAHLSDVLYAIEKLPEPAPGIVEVEEHVAEYVPRVKVQLRFDVNASESAACDLADQLQDLAENLRKTSWKV